MRSPVILHIWTAISAVGAWRIMAWHSIWYTVANICERPSGAFRTRCLISERTPILLFGTSSVRSVPKSSYANACAMIETSVFVLLVCLGEWIPTRRVITTEIPVHWQPFFCSCLWTLFWVCVHAIQSHTTIRSRWNMLVAEQPARVRFGRRRAWVWSGRCTRRRRRRAFD